MHRSLPDRTVQPPLRNYDVPLNTAGHLLASPGRTMGRPPASPLSMDSIIFSTPVLPAPPVSWSKSMGVSHYGRIRQRKIIAL
jgi:hypothetical protein